jgi:hypothetical protein
MSQNCPINSASPLGCLDFVSGKKTIYITESKNRASSTISVSGEITAMTLNSGTKFWQFDMENEDAQFTADFTQTNLTSGVWAHSGVFTRKGFSQQQRHLINLLIKNRVMIMTLDWNGVYELFGYNGGVLTTVANTSGKAFGEFAGSTLTFTSNEPEAPYFVNSSIIAALLLPAMP